MLKRDQSKLGDIISHADVEDIVARFYDAMLVDSIVGFIFTDIAKISLEAHLPLISNFWSDILFVKNQEQKQYHGNVLKKHLELNQLIKLKPGHFTRWLYLFNQAIDARYSGPNADLMKARAERVANSISAAVTDQKKGEMKLVLPKS